MATRHERRAPSGPPTVEVTPNDSGGSSMKIEGVKIPQLGRFSITHDPRELPAVNLGVLAVNGFSLSLPAAVVNIEVVAIEPWVTIEVSEQDGVKTITVRPTEVKDEQQG